MGICGSSPAVKQNAEPAVGQNGHEARTSTHPDSQQPLHAAHEASPEVPAQNTTVTELPLTTKVVHDWHMHSVQTV